MMILRSPHNYIPRRWILFFIQNNVKTDTVMCKVILVPVYVTVPYVLEHSVLGSGGITPQFLTSVVGGKRWDWRPGRFSSSDIAPSAYYIGDWVGPRASAELWRRESCLASAGRRTAVIRPLVWADHALKQWYSAFFCFRVPGCNFITTFYSQSCWWIIRVIHNL
jgi:hypothetical protein